MDDCLRCGSPLSDPRRPCAACGYSSGEGTRPVVPTSELADRTIVDERYVISRALGRGALSISYLAHDSKRSGAPVVLKALPQIVHADRVLLAGLRREAQAVARLHHRNLVQLYNLEGRSCQYLISDYVDGSSLFEMLARSGSAGLPPDVAMVLFEGIAAGLDHAHDMGILHKNLRPSNLFSETGPFGTVGKVGDLSVGWELRQLIEAGPRGRSFGTVGYVSPEQLRGEVPDRRSDIYSLAAVIYHLLAGRPAFAEIDVTLAVLSMAPAPAPRIPPPVMAVLARALSKDRSLRPATCTELVTELVRELPATRTLTPIPGPRPSPGGPRAGPFEPPSGVTVDSLYGRIVSATTIVAYEPGVQGHEPDPSSLPGTVPSVPPDPVIPPPVDPAPAPATSSPTVHEELASPPSPAAPPAGSAGPSSRRAAGAGSSAVAAEAASTAPAPALRQPQQRLAQVTLVPLPGVASPPSGSDGAHGSTARLLVGLMVVAGLGLLVWTGSRPSPEAGESPSSLGSPSVLAAVSPSPPASHSSAAPSVSPSSTASPVAPSPTPSASVAKGPPSIPPASRAKPSPKPSPAAEPPQARRARFDALVALGDRLYFKVGDFQKALAAYHAAQDVDRDSAMLWRKVGLCRVKLGQLPRAVEALENARRLAPDDAAILNTLAVLFLKSKLPKLALVHASSAVRIRPDDPNVWDTLAEAQGSLKDTRGAVASYRKVLVLDPKNGKAKAALKNLGAPAKDRKR